MNGILLSLLLICLPFQLGRHFWLKSSYLLGLKIDYLSPTLYIQDILIFILFFLRRKEIIFFLKSHIKLLIAYCLLLIANIYFSLTPLLSFFAWIRISEFILLGLVISQNKEEVFNLLGKAFPGIVIFEFILGSLQFLKESSLGGIFWFFGERTFNILTPGIARGIWSGKVFLRPYGTFSHPNSLAGFILVAVIFIISKKTLSLFDKLATICGLLLIILCFSRVVWLAGLIFGVCFVLKTLFCFKTQKLSLNFFYLFSLFSILIAVFLFKKTTLEISSFENRMKLAEHALLIVKRSPLLGIGANNFIGSLAAGNTVWQWYYWLQPVHNIFLLVAGETGLIGLVIFAGFLVLTVKRLLQSYILSDLADYRPLLLIVLMIILITGLFDHYWLTLIQNQLLFTMILGLSWSNEKC